MHRVGQNTHLKKYFLNESDEREFSYYLAHSGLTQGDLKHLYSNPFNLFLKGTCMAIYSRTVLEIKCAKYNSYCGESHAMFYLSHIYWMNYISCVYVCICENIFLEQ